jgi:hypothetical protein
LLQRQAATVGPTMHNRRSNGRVNPPPGRAAFVDNVSRSATLSKTPNDQGRVP